MSSIKHRGVSGKNDLRVKMAKNQLDKFQVQKAKNSNKSKK